MKYFKILFLPFLCAVCFSACGVANENGSENMYASEKATSAPDSEEMK